MKTGQPYSYRINPDPAGYYFMIFCGDIEIMVSEKTFRTQEQAQRAAEEELAWRLRLWKGNK